MRRFASLGLPLFALVLACMQDMPGDSSNSRDGGSDPGCRIGGTSVGCGNPTKTVADVNIETTNCRELGCPAGYPDIEYKVSWGENIRLLFRPIGGDPLFGGQAGNRPDSIRPLIVTLRYGNQLSLLDSSVLDTLEFASLDTVDISFDRVCRAVDQPDRFCSEGRWTEIPLTLQLERRFFAQGGWWRKVGYLRNFVLNSHDHDFEPKNEEMSLLQSLHTMATPRGKYETKMIWRDSFPNERPLRIVFSPGTSLATTLCGDSAPLFLDSVPQGRHPLRTVTLKGSSVSAWVPVYSLDTLHSQSGFFDLQIDTLRQGALIDSLFIRRGFTENLRDKLNCP